MSDSESGELDAELLEEERRIREQYSLQPDEDEVDGGQFNDEANDDAYDANLAPAAIADQIHKFEADTARLQEERDHLKEQVCSHSGQVSQE